MELIVLLKLASPMLSLVTKELGRVVQENALQLWDVDKNLKELQATYLQIDGTLGKLDCSTSRFEPWLNDLVMYCYDTEDLVDGLILAHSFKIQDIHQWRKYAMKHMDLKIPGQIVKLQKELELLRNQIERLLPQGEINSTQSQNSGLRSSVASYNRLLSDETSLVSGTTRDRDKATIIMELKSVKPRQSGVSIVGMDGFGKTSLVLSIMADEGIREEFPLILSASVSDDFQSGEIVKKLVAYHSETSPTTAELDRRERIPSDATSRRILQDLVGKQRVLIILDDLWSVPDGEWERFISTYLKCRRGNSNPSWKILTTTRNPKVAEVTQTVAHYLDRMTDKDCEILITGKLRVSGSDFEISASDVEDIAKKCNGIPIVAAKFGFTLSRNVGPEKLIEIMRKLKNTTLWELLEFKEVFPSLKLNDPMLPPHLRRCLAYCSLFTHNHKFNRDELIQLWEVEGIAGGSQQTGSQCFDDLLSLSIFQPFYSSNSKQLAYKMQELNFMFSQLLASKAFLRIDEGNPNLLPSCKYIRHLSLTCENISVPLLDQIKKCEGLRTFLLLPPREPKIRNIPSSFFHKLKRLRLLDLSYTNISQLLEPYRPNANIIQQLEFWALRCPLKKLTHLRYLNLSGTDIQKLPKSIKLLCALQVLKLENCSELEKLPDELNEVISLTHLHVNHKRLQCLPINFGVLTNLEVLISYRVGKKEGNKLAELKNMTHLREICISRLENVNDKREAEESMLRLKSNLRKLVLEWEIPPASAQVVNLREVLEGLEPHDDLTDLVVRNYKCQQFPAWLSSPSKKFLSICLQHCQSLPSLGQLPLLKTLVLHSIDDVEVLDERFRGQGECAFPRLELLELCEMQKLLLWTGLKPGDMPCLYALRIIDCPELVCLPSLDDQGRLVSMEIRGCPKLTSLTGESSNLKITACPLVDERCQVGGADWEKIKHINGRNIAKDGGKTARDEPSSSQVQPTITKWMDAVHENKVSPASPSNGYNVKMKRKRD